jgi:hypothetical protein
MPKSDLSSRTTCNNISDFILFTPNGEANHELLFNTPASVAAMFLGPGKTTYAFSVMFRLACYQQVGRVWSGVKGTENTLALAENVYVVLPTPHVFCNKLFSLNEPLETESSIRKIRKS